MKWHNAPNVNNIAAKSGLPVESVGEVTMEIAYILRQNRKRRPNANTGHVINVHYGEGHLRKI